jgi:hypothetical protein
VRVHDPLSMWYPGSRAAVVHCTEALEPHAPSNELSAPTCSSHEREVDATPIKLCVFVPLKPPSLAWLMHLNCAIIRVGTSVGIVVGIVVGT